MTSTLAVGEILKSTYVVERHLVTDLFCETYALTDQKKTRSLIGMRVLPELASKNGYLQKFEESARRLTGIRHRNLVPVVDFWAETADRCFLITEEPIGHSLRNDLTLPRQHTPLPRPLSFVRSQGIYRQLSEALDALHSGGSLHLDLRPENIFVHNTSADSVCVSLTGMGIVIPGFWFQTPCPDAALPYQAPEQFLGETVTEKADQFVLASIIYEMLKGSQAFRRQQDEGETVIYKIKREDPIPFALPSQASPGFSRALNRAFSKHPQQRHASIREFCNDIGIPLTSIHSAHGIVHTPPTVNGIFWPWAGSVVAGVAAAVFLLKTCYFSPPVHPDAGMAEHLPADMSADLRLKLDQSVSTNLAGRNHVNETKGKSDAGLSVKTPDLGAKKTATQARDLGLADSGTKGSDQSGLKTGSQAAGKGLIVLGAKGSEPAGKKPPGQVGSKDPAVLGAKTEKKTDGQGQTSTGAKRTSLTEAKTEGGAGKGTAAPATQAGSQAKKILGGQKGGSSAAVPPGSGSASESKQSQSGAGNSIATEPRSCAQELDGKLVLAPAGMSSDQKQSLFECLQVLNPCDGVTKIEINLLATGYVLSDKSSDVAKRSTAFRKCIRQMIPDSGTDKIKIWRRG